MPGDLDAVAVPGPTQYPSAINVLGLQAPTTVSNATSQIEAMPKGSYGALVIQQNGVDHVIGFLNQGGNEIFVGTQSGHIVTLNPSLTVKIGTPP